MRHPPVVLLLSLAAAASATVVEGVPRYRTGEDVVVFLYRTPAGLLRTRGLVQGKLSVTAEGRVRLNASGAESQTNVTLAVR